MVEALRGDVDEVSFGGVAVLPVDRVAGSVCEAHVFAHGLGEHGGIIILADDPVAVFVLFQERGSEPEVAEAAAAFPANSLTDAALIRAVDDFLQTWEDVGVAMFA